MQSKDTPPRLLYKPEYPLGEYIKRWCKYNGVTQTQIASGCGYNEKTQMYKLKTSSVKNLFRIVDFMAKNSKLSEEFYMMRIKQVIQGRYLWEIK